MHIALRDWGSDLDADLGIDLDDEPRNYYSIFRFWVAAGTPCALRATSKRSNRIHPSGRDSRCPSASGSYLLTLLTACGGGTTDPRSSDPRSSEPQSSDSGPSMRAATTATPASGPQLVTGLAEHHHPITTSSAEAQKFVDQGFALGVRLQPRRGRPFVPARGRARSEGGDAVLGHRVGGGPQLQPGSRRPAGEAGVSKRSQTATSLAASTVRRQSASTSPRWRSAIRRIRRPTAPRWRRQYSRPWAS